MTQYKYTPTTTLVHTGPAEHPSNTQLLEAQVQSLNQQLHAQRRRIARLEQTITQLETIVNSRR